jgi:hypothetical protein
MACPHRREIPMSQSGGLPDGNGDVKVAHDRLPDLPVASVRDQTSAIHELFVSVLRSNLDLGQRQHAPVADRERAVEHVAEFGFRVDTQCVEDRGVDVGRRAWL